MLSRVKGHTRSAVEIYNTNSNGAAADWGSSYGADAGSWLKAGRDGEDASSEAEYHDE
jgi:hypothetical protein